MSKQQHQARQQPPSTPLIHTSRTGIKTTIPPLEADYEAWSSVFELILHQEGLWTIVNGAEQRPAKSSYEPYVDKEAAYLEGVAKAFDKRNADALLFLYNYSGFLAERVLKEREGRTAHEVWLLMREWKDDVKLASGAWMKKEEARVKGLLGGATAAAGKGGSSGGRYASGSGAAKSEGHRR